MITPHPQAHNILSTWWLTVDRLILFCIIAIICIGAIMVTTASPAVAERLQLEGFYFVKRQLVYLVLATGVIFLVSLLSPVAIRRFSIIGFSGGIVLLIIVLFLGVEIKGAHRWLHIGSLSIQPSEFMKPFFIVVTAWFLSQHHTRNGTYNYKLCIILYAVLVSLLILQPDFGMVVIITAVWGGQLFLAGLPLLWIGIGTVCSVIGVISAYTFLPHVAQRINSFLDPTGESYQVRKSLEAFMHGGFFGRGPGEGTVKQFLPDSHTDFIFSVAGEELGILACLGITALFAIVVIRSFMRVMQEADLFIVYAVSGLAMAFGLQACINIGVTLNLLPTKGMTLPFISYGGSSLLAIAIAVGMLLALTRKRFGPTAMRRHTRM